MKTQKGGGGFTLVELMVVVAMVAVVVGMSLPAMYQFVVNVKTKSAARSVYDLLQHGRILAVREGRPVRVQFGVAKPEGNFSQVLLGFDRSDDNWLSEELDEEGNPVDDIRERVSIALPVKAQRKDPAIREVVFTPQGVLTGPSAEVEIMNGQTPRGYALKVSPIGSVGMRGKTGGGGCS